MWKFLEDLGYRCAITFTNDPDKYDEDSFLEINQFFIDHQIPFSDSFFFEPAYNPQFNYQTHKDLIDEYIKKGRIEILHGIPDFNEYDVKGIKAFTNHGHRIFDLFDFGNLASRDFEIVSTNSWYDVEYQKPPFYLYKDSGIIDFKRYHTKFGQRKRTSQWDYFPKIYSNERIMKMKEIGNVYFGYMHMSRNKHPFTEEARKAVIRIADDNEIFVTTTINMINKIRDNNV